MLAIPFALDVAYKDGFFKLGTSSVGFDRDAMRDTLRYSWPSDPVLNLDAGLDRYGMFGPAGTHLLGGNTGLSLFTNAALPFLNASNFAAASAYYNLPDATVNPAAGTEPSLPSWPQTYAFNTVVLDINHSAMLDAPNPDWVSAVRASMRIGDSWNLTADVLATFATYVGPATSGDLFDSFCARAKNESSLREQDLDVSAGIALAESFSGGSILYFGYLHYAGDYLDITCGVFKPAAMRYNLSRRPCQGQWTLTRGGSQLMRASCDVSAPVDFEKQDVFTPGWSLKYTNFYPLQLGESPGPFAKNRAASLWLRPATNIMIAAMAWSRLTALSSAADNKTAALGKWDSIGNATDWHLLYEADSTVSSTKPTMRRSWILYLIFGVQPALTVAAYIGVVLLRSTPINKGCGLVSIWAGVERQCLDLLRGASFSGDLTKDVKIAVRQGQESEKYASVSYTLL